MNFFLSFSLHAMIVPWLLLCKKKKKNSFDISPFFFFLREGWKKYLVSARKCNGPSLKAADQLFAGDVPFGITDNASCHNKGKDSRATAIWQLRESIQKSHHRIPRVSHLNCWLHWWHLSQALYLLMIL